MFISANQATASPLPLARLQLEEVVNSMATSGGAGASGADRAGAAGGVCGSPLSQRSGFLQSNIRRESSHVLADISEVETVIRVYSLRRDESYSIRNGRVLSKMLFVPEGENLLDAMQTHTSLSFHSSFSEGEEDPCS